MQELEQDVIDRGFRLNICIVLRNSLGKVLLAQRHDGRNAWQFPQGGMMPGESPQQAMYRELFEEIGLKPCDIDILGHSSRWFHYRIPPDRIPLGSGAIGQKQRWFLLALRSQDQAIDLVRGSTDPEFVSWRWVDYWEPIERVARFKRHVYRQGLEALQTFCLDTN